jgi:hypothetical protein
MPKMDLTHEEALHIRTRRRSENRDHWFQQGLEAAAREVLQWDGVAEEGERKAIANAIAALKRPRKKQQKKGV